MSKGPGEPNMQVRPGISPDVVDYQHPDTLVPPPPLWRSFTFWSWYIVLFIPSQFVFFGVPSALFLNQDTMLIAGLMMWASGELLACLVPFLIAHYFARVNSKP